MLAKREPRRTTNIYQHSSCQHFSLPSQINHGRDVQSNPVIESGNRRRSKQTKKQQQQTFDRIAKTYVRSHSQDVRSIAQPTRTTAKTYEADVRSHSQDVRQPRRTEQTFDRTANTAKTYKADEEATLAKREVRYNRLRGSRRRNEAPTRTKKRGLVSRQLTTSK